jgi:threonine/homoserine/homoserine lactone efflux protein
METYISFVLAALALVGSPGPNTLSLAAVGAAFGMRRGIGFMLGLTFGMLLVIIIVG